MTATAGLIGFVAWSVQAIGQLEQQRTQKNTLEKLLESIGKDQETVPSSADASDDSSLDSVDQSVQRSAEKGNEIHGAPNNSMLHPFPDARPLGAPGNPIVRVALLSQSPPRAVDLSGQAECRFSNGEVVQQRTLKNLFADHRSNLVTCQSGQNGAVVVNERSYPETIYFLNRGDGWIAINQLSLERYVASVVGAEMPSHWNTEALKAQAVAARSYAVVHLVRPADSDFNLGDTTRWQAYGGLNSQSEPTAAATKATQGLVLSFQGGLVESLYASTSEIAAEAHSHLGASMSQHGAQNLAMKGLKFNEILSHYYVGASLARLKTNGN